MEHHKYSKLQGFPLISGKVQKDKLNASSIHMANEITTSGVHFPNEYVGNVFKQGERPK
jgi:hypothetical protein